MRIAHESRHDITDRHDVTGPTRARTRGARKNVKPSQIVGAGLCLLGLSIGAYVFWPTTPAPNGQAAEAVARSASAIPTPGTGPDVDASSNHAITAFAERSAYAYLRLLRGDTQEQQVTETQRHKQSLVTVGISTDLDYGHHPGGAPEGIVPTAIIPVRQENLSNTDTKVTLNARLSAHRWIGLAMTIRDHGDQTYGLVNRPTFVPVESPSPIVMEAYPKGRNRALEKSLAVSVQDRMRTWAVETDGLGGAFELARVHELIVGDDQPEHGPVNGLVALDWIEPLSGDTFSQVYGFHAQRTGDKWSVTPQP